MEWNGINIEDRSFFCFVFCLPGLSPAWASWESLFNRLANLGFAHKFYVLDFLKAIGARLKPSCPLEGKKKFFR